MHAQLCAHTPCMHKRAPTHSQLHRSFLSVEDAHSDEIWICKWSHNGNYLATGAKDGTVIIWQLHMENIDLNKGNNKNYDNNTGGALTYYWQAMLVDSVSHLDWSFDDSNILMHAHVHTRTF